MNNGNFTSFSSSAHHQEVNNNHEKHNGDLSSNKNGQQNPSKINHGMVNTGKTIDTKINAPKVAKASKKMGASQISSSAAIAASVAAKGNRPSMEIYRPPGMRHSSAKSTEDISSSASSPPIQQQMSTKPSLVAGTKQPLSATSSTQLHHTGATSNMHNYNYVFTQQQQQFGPNYRQDTRTYTNRQASGLEREKSKSSKNLNYQQYNGYGGQRSDYDDYYERMRRSQTPPPSLAASRQMSCPDHLGKKAEEGGKLKRQRSFIKDQPKKKSSAFTEKEAAEARMMLMALEMAQDEYVADWIAGGYMSEEVANTVGQVLVQLAIEHGKSVKLITKLSSLLMECNSGESFHKGLVTSSYRYFECREQLRAEHFRFWLNFVNFLSELHANMGITYEGELSQILFQLYDYLLQNPILEQLKIEELESMITSLMSVGYDLERQCPDRLTELRNTLRNAFITVQEPWARKMILLLIELSASNWKLPSEANEYYFQTHSTSVSG